MNGLAQRQQPAQASNAYYNPFDLNSQNQSFADKTNPSALLNAFNVRQPKHGLGREASPVDVNQ